MSSENLTAVPAEASECANCHHCINVQWTEKIICLAYLEVRPLSPNGECPEFVRQKWNRTTRAVGNATDKRSPEGT